jgi:hypothetical protein
MKPCKSCPFHTETLAGMWEPAHYLGVAYLMCLDHADVIHESMGCHQWNGKVNEKLTQEDSPICGGWMRSAKGTLAMRLKFAFDKADPAEAHDGFPVMTPEEMMRHNGFDMDKLPPLKWESHNPAHRARYPSYGDWETEVLALRAAVRADPEVAREYALPGGPLETVTREEIAAFIGEEVTARCYGEDG